MVIKRKGWTVYKVGYDNGEYRYFDNDHNALLHAGRMAKSMAVVCVYGPDDTLIARWVKGRNVYYAPYISDSLI